ncbi:MAG TPA: acyl-CoA dehydrogenase family protein, partial [Dehalococcoidia bacterium]|nr:acyl-CoA dehydrogenase family protein [Dehalococcoidia bacterium]
MDFHFTPEQDQLRADVRAFLAERLPAAAEDIAEGYHWGFDPNFSRALGEQGWLGVTFPTEYGGRGWGYLEQAILNEELGYARAPTACHRTGVFYVAPVLLLHGNEDQKRAFLPAIARGEAPFCQGFSEPNSGSDLASLRTRAVRDGDDWIVNGQKIWTTEAHHAEYCWLTARTNPDNPKHRGISCFIVDMASPGVSVRPVISL